MPDLLPLVLAALDVRRTLLECGVDVQDHADNRPASTVCPACKGRLLIYPDELACTTAGCTFVAGNIVDYFALLENGLEPGLARLYRHQAAILDKIHEFPWNVTKEQLTAELRARRAVLDFFFTRAAPPLIPAIAQTEAWLRAGGIDTKLCSRTLFVLAPHELTTLLHLIGTTQGEPPLPTPKGDAFAVTPLLRSFSRLAALTVRHRNRAHVGLVPVDPAQVALSGVWEIGGTLAQARVCDGVGPAAAYTTHSRQFGLGRPCLGLHYTASADEGWRVAQLTYLLQSSETLATAARLYGTVDNLLVGSYQLQPLAESHRSFETAYLDRLVALFQTGGLKSVELGRFIHSISIPYRIRHKISEELERRDLMSLAEMLRLSGTTGGIYAIRNVVITDTPDGYLIRRKRDPQPTRLTNFTLHFENNVRFADAPEVYHHCHVLFRSERYPLLLARATLHSPKDLESAVHAAFLRLTKSTTNLPTIFDKPLAAPLPVLFNILLEPLHTIEGVSQLGWSNARDRLVAPGAVLTPGGCEFSELVPHPDKPLLKLFTAVNPPRMDLPDPRQDITRLCALAAHFMVRLHLGRPVFPVSYRDTPSARMLLQAAFRSLGQLQPLTLNGNDRGASVLTGVAGWPVLASGLPSGSETRFYAPLVLLQDRGLPCHEADLEQAPWLWRVVHTVGMWLLRLPAAQMPELTADTGDGIEEGLRLLRFALPGVTWSRPVIPRPLLWEALRQTAATDLGAWLAHDFEKQRVRCDLKAAPVREIAVELTTLGASIQGQVAWIPSMALLGVLSEFYGYTPTLPPVPPERTEPVVADKNNQGWNG